MWGSSCLRRYFPIGWDLFYTDYVYNPYALRVDIIDLQVMDTGGWFDGDVDPYINLYLRDGKGTERKLLSDAGGLINNWKSSSIPMGEIIDIKDELGRWWYYGISHPGKDYFGIEVRDADVWFDDWLMEPAERDYQTFTGTQLIDWEKSNSIITVDAP